MMVTTDCSFYYCSGTGGFYENLASGLSMIIEAYAGLGDGVNNPTWDHVVGKGPLPAGKYTMYEVDFKVHPEWAHMGPIIFELRPDASNKMYGRSMFFIHWDDSSHTDRASEGCIILPWQWCFLKIQAAIRAGKNRLEVGATPVYATPPYPKPLAA